MADPVSTYVDNTAALTTSGWIFVRAVPGWDFQPRATDATKLERRSHFVVIRTGNMKDPILFTIQVGQVGIGLEVGGFIGTTWWFPSPVDPLDPTKIVAFECTEDEVDLIDVGTNMLRRTQVWEHFGTWADYDETALRTT